MMKLLRGRVSVSKGFVLLIAFLLILDSETNFLVPAILACIAHEMGHIAMGWAFGTAVQKITVTAIGAEIKFFYEERISYSKDLLITAAGPATSLIMALVAARFKKYIFAGMCLGQGIFNLLPIPPLDGGRFLKLILLNWKNGIWADAAIEAVAMIVVLLIAAGGLVVLLRYGNPTLLITAGWILTGTLKISKEE